MYLVGRSYCLLRLQRPSQSDPRSSWGMLKRTNSIVNCSDSMDAEVCASYKELPHVQNRYVTAFHIQTFVSATTLYRSKIFLALL